MPDTIKSPKVTNCIYHNNLNSETLTLWYDINFACLSLSWNNTMLIFDCRFINGYAMLRHENRRPGLSRASWVLWGRSPSAFYWLSPTGDTVVCLGLTENKVGATSDRLAGSTVPVAAPKKFYSARGCNGFPSCRSRPNQAALVEIAERRLFCDSNITATALSDQIRFLAAVRSSLEKSPFKQSPFSAKIVDTTWESKGVWFFSSHHFCCAASL